MADGSLDTGTSQTHRRRRGCHEQSVENPGAIREIGYKDEWQLAIIFNHGSVAASSVRGKSGIWNVIFWFWIFGLGLLFATLGWLCFETWGETGKLLFGNILQFVAPHQALTDSEVWRAETVVTQPRYWEHWDIVTKYGSAACKYFIKIRQNSEILVLSELKETLSVYLCNSYRESNCQWIIMVCPPPVYSTLASHFASSHHHRGRNVTDSWYISSLKSVFARSWSVSKQTSLLPQILPLLLSTHITSQLQTKNIILSGCDIWLSWLIFAAIILTEFPFCTNYVRPQKASVPACRVPSGETQLEKCHI